MKKAVVFLVLALTHVGHVCAQDPQVQSVPEKFTEKGFRLEVQHAAERPEYMSPSVSSTVLRGFSDRKACWDHANAIAKAIQDAASDTKHKGRTLFSCAADTEFKREGVMNSMQSSVQ